MQSHTMPFALVAAGVIVVAGLVLLARGPSGELPPVVQRDASEAAPPSDAPVVLAVAEPIAPSSDALVAATVRELEEMSETFRNTTFLIAIRDAGFICHDLLSVYGGLNDSAAWTASCSDMLAYTVRVASAGRLHIEPMLEQLDSIGPVVAPGEPTREPVQILPRRNR